MMEYLDSKGIQSIRMGKRVEDPIDDACTIDYANRFYDNLMDIYLTHECKFFVNDPSGVDIFVYIYGKPHVLVNDVMAMASPSPGGFPQSENTILIFKKIWSKKKGRFLKFDETLEAQWQCVYSKNSDEIKMEFDFIDNSEEEILDAVKEMNDRIDEVWVESEDDAKRQMIVRQMIDKHYINHRREGNLRYTGRIGTAFLRNNARILGIE